MKLRLYWYFANPTSLIGAILATVSFGASSVLLILDLLSEHWNPYRGILTYAVFPTFLFIGIAISLAGAILRRRRKGVGFPVLDLNLPKHQRWVFIVVTFSLLLLLLSALGGYRAYLFTEEVEFCGTLCHKVMEPEYTAYLDSPHARVKCVECHVGSGAEWYVKAKISGLYQVYAVLADKYPKPIPTPIENLRPAQDTCEQCHWPKKFWGSQLTERVHFAYDVANTRRDVLMLVKTGGGGSAHGPSEGIHWHMNTRNHVEYIARDERRLDIPWVKVTHPDGTSTEYVNVDKPPTAEELTSLPTRRMDCMDCHNRPSHRLLSPEAVVDELMGIGRVDPRVPYMKTEAVAVLAVDYESKEEALRGIEQGLLKSYSEKHPDLASRYRREIAAAVPELQALYLKNFFPEMKTSWADFPDHISHKEFPGCFRCHNDRHRDAEGKALKTDCDLCHSFVARDRPESPLVPIAADPSYFHPWTKVGKHGSMNCWDCHTGKSSPYGTCSQCHTMKAGAPMAFACITCHVPQTQTIAALQKSCVGCHALGGSLLHLTSEHRTCSDCHRAHDWKSRDPEDCSSRCHTELAKTHYPGKACTPCHELRGVTSGFGSAPVPPILESLDRRPGSARAAQKPPAEPKGPPAKPSPPEGPSQAPPPAEGGPPQAASYGKDCLQSGCHAELLERPRIHLPVIANACDRCHVESPDGRHCFTLVAPEPDLCTACHVRPKDKLVIHQPFAEGSCLACHDPHGGETPPMLRAGPPEGICIQCHERREGELVHSTLPQGECSKCHLSHQSDHAMLLPAKEVDLCTSCHPKVEKELREGRQVHKPIEKGCSQCHRAHASSNPAIVTAFYTPDFYAGFEAETYALCFLCHARELFYKDKSTLTGFRDGDRNLHFVHVNKPVKGRTCRACHVTHASEGPRLVRKNVPFGSGGWLLPIGFEPTPTGGTCATGCHKQQTYDRVTPVAQAQSP
ncbi:MAG: NapC/NirT family cytochrome c [Planctomycetes bacterium]|nr:NapC/NirT family cytochrome c [Planctomycetota bacterium]